MSKANAVLNFIKRRLPATNEIVLVASVAVFLVFSWSLRDLFFVFPSMILIHTGWDIVAIIAYRMTWALVESAITLAVVMALAFVLPGRWFREGFAYKGSYAILSLAAVAIFLQLRMTNQPKIPWLGLQLVRGLAAWVVAVLLTGFIPLIRKIVLDLLDRLTIFLYLFLPVGAISLLIVTVRLLWYSP